MRPQRTVRRPTRWTPDEWRRVEAAADAHNVPPARFVREAVLAAVEGGASPTRPRPVRRRVRDELVHQLGRVLNNLRQLERLATEDANEDLRQLAAFVCGGVEDAIRRAPARSRDAGTLVEELVKAGRALNELVHRANTDEALPPVDDVIAAVKPVYRFVTKAVP
jgi:hypothetical protein